MQCDGCWLLETVTVGLKSVFKERTHLWHRSNTSCTAWNRLIVWWVKCEHSQPVNLRSCLSSKYSNAVVHCLQRTRRNSTRGGTAKPVQTVDSWRCRLPEVKPYANRILTIQTDPFLIDSLAMTSAIFGESNMLWDLIDCWLRKWYWLRGQWHNGDGRDLGLLVKIETTYFCLASVFC